MMIRKCRCIIWLNRVIIMVYCISVKAIELYCLYTVYINLHAVLINSSSYIVTLKMLTVDILY